MKNKKWMAEVKRNYQEKYHSRSELEGKTRSVAPISGFFNVRSCLSVGAIVATWSVPVAHAILPLVVGIPMLLVGAILSETRIDEIHDRRAYFVECVLKHEAVVREFLPESVDEFLKEPRELRAQRKTLSYDLRSAYFERLSQRLERFRSPADLMSAKNCFLWLSGDDLMSRESSSDKKTIRSAVDRISKEFIRANPILGFTNYQESWESHYRSYEILLGLKEILDTNRDMLLRMRESVQPKLTEYAKYLKSNEYFAVSLLGSRERANDIVARFVTHRNQMEQLSAKYHSSSGADRKTILNEINARAREHAAIGKIEDRALMSGLSPDQIKHVKELTLLAVHYLGKRYSSTPAMLKAVSLLGPWDRIKEMTQKLSVAEQLAMVVVLANELPRVPEGSADATVY